MKKNILKLQSFNLPICNLSILLLFLLLGGCKETGELHLLEWKVGQWVSYKINDEPVKVSIVGRDSSYFWIETVEPEIIVKALVPVGKLNEPKRLIVKRIGESPVEFKVAELSIKSGLPNLKSENFAGNKEILVLPRGKFKVVHVREHQRDIWLSEVIPIFGIAKYKSKDTLIVLQNYGLKGAKSEIAEQGDIVKQF